MFLYEENMAGQTRDWFQIAGTVRKVFVESLFRGRERPTRQQNQSPGLNLL